MPSDPADLPVKAGRPRWWVAGLVLVVLVAVGLVVLVRQPQDAVLPSSRTTAGAMDSADARSGAAGALVERIAGRLERGTRGQVVALAAPHDARAAGQLATLRDNVRRIGITHLTMRYVDDDSTAVSRPGSATWVGRVQLAWRVGGYDRRDSMLEVPITFRQVGGRARFVTARRTHGDATPLWMLGRVFVRRTARALVLTVQADQGPRYIRLADQAVVDVQKVLPRWRGRLVVEVPRDQRGVTRVLGSEPGAYREIAAVTTTVDGTLAHATPVHIFVNPQVFDPLGPRGSQIVMSHEATHVAVGAAFSSMPTWLLEGFADYVALAHAGLPPSVAASQILGRVRTKGLPSHLPGKAEFDPQNTALGASYEAAWLACRLLGEMYGESRLIAFYRASDRSSSTVRAFRRVLGTDEAAFTAAWRADLRRLAG